VAPTTEGKTVEADEIEAQKPLRSVGAYSMIKEFEPANSPPAENPWVSRQTRSSTGASRPTCP
jgi:hypothetical protein